MIWTIAIIFILLWVIGLVTSYTLGGFIHVLIGVAVALLLVRIIQGRRASKSVIRTGGVTTRRTGK